MSPVLCFAPTLEWFDILLFFSQVSLVIFSLGLPVGEGGRWTGTVLRNRRGDKKKKERESGREGESGRKRGGEISEDRAVCPGIGEWWRQIVLHCTQGTLGEI